MEVLGSAIAKRDSDTHLHNYRVTLYAIRLAEALNMNDEGIRNLIIGALLHDVGKIGIPDAILLKPARLTPDEFEIMKTHTQCGVEIIGKSLWLKNARDVIEYHHEKFNGCGYPKGLKGVEIPLNARIFAVVDVFDALTSRRPYKEPLPPTEAIAILRNGSGSHFDPALVESFIPIAASLHAKMSALPEESIETVLADLLTCYFFVSRSVFEETTLMSAAD
jgi:putative nucleotidyltransferase with HDIG domain